MIARCLRFRIAMMLLPLGLLAGAARAEICGAWSRPLDGSSVRSLTYGGGRWVASTTMGPRHILWSTDAYTWTSEVGPASGAAVTWTGDRYMATRYSSGEKLLFTSTDLMHWTAGAHPPDRFITRAFSNGNTAVAHGTDGLVWTADYTNWTPTGTPYISESRDIAWNGTAFAIGFDGADDDGLWRAWTGKSSDGRSWTFTMQPLPPPVPQVTRILSIGRRWVGTPEDFGLRTWRGQPLVSDDAVTWTPSAAAPSLGWLSKADSFVYGWDGSGQLWRSADGLSWELDPLNAAKATTGRFFGGGAITGTAERLMVGSMLYQADAQPHFAHLFRPSAGTDVVWTGKEFVGSFHEYSSGSSPDGTFWRRVYPPGGLSWYSYWGSSVTMAWSGRRVVNVGYENYGVSEDGVTWKIGEPGWMLAQDVAWNGEMFVTVGGYCPSDPVHCRSWIAMSGDGEQWAIRTSTGDANLPAAHLRAITWDGSRFVAVGDGPWSIWTSPNGLHWTPRYGGRNLADVAWNGSTFIASGDGILKSSDGVGWTLQSVEKGVSRLLWSGTRWYAAGEVANPPLASVDILSSDDGTSWTAEADQPPWYAASPTRRRGLAFNGDRMVLLRPDGTLVRSCTGIVGPIVSSASPRRGAPAGGTVVRVVGQHFDPASSVLFGSTPAAGVTFVSSTVLDAIAPPGNGTVGLTVTRSDGGTATLPAAYTYREPVVRIDTFSPRAAAGGSVAIGGDGFTGASVVTFGGVSVPFRVISDAMIVAEANESGFITITAPLGTATSAVPFNRPPRAMSAARLRSDVDGDGQADILSRWDGLLTAHLMDRGRIRQSVQIPAGPFLRVAGTGDFDANGTSDIALYDDAGGTSVIKLLGASGVVAEKTYRTLAHPWRMFAVSDFNGDGKADILWQNPATGAWLIWFLSGVEVVSGSAYLYVDPAFHLMSVSDFNGDRKGDLLWFNPQTGVLDIWIMDSGRFVTDRAYAFAGSPWTIAGTGDFNGDGHTDIVWNHTTTGRYLIWYMNGPEVVSGSAYLYVDPSFSLRQIGDFDGDGRADLVWVNQFYFVDIWFVDGATLQWDAAISYLPGEIVDAF